VLFRSSKIILPKEEPKKHKVIIVGNGIPKQETLEEAFKKTYLGQRLFFDSNEGKSFEEGAKWKQEQDKNKYSEEEVKHLLYLFLEHVGEKQKRTILNVVPNEWFEEFKKNKL
jgi:hypothetical protein